MSEQLLTLLKFSLLALLYLFLFRVVRAVWAEISPRAAGAPAEEGSRRGRRGRGVPPSTPPAGAGAVATAAAPSRAEAKQAKRAAKQARSAGTELVVVEPAEAAGQRFALPEEATVGRAPGCQITVDDTFASQLHARVFRAEGRVHVEDLGSTNGTLLNGERVGGPRPMATGDRLQVGGTVLELR